MNTNDVNSKRAYCYVFQDRRIIIYNNYILPASTILYIDIFQIKQPKDLTSKKIIITLDMDGNYTNGVAKYG
jgi:hypothetical protein